MRVALFAQWFRSLAQLHGRGLEALGHEVLVVTSEAHFEPGYGFVDEVRLPIRLKSRWWREWSEARSAVRAFDPEVVLIDETWDFRFAGLIPRVPWSLVVHEAVIHSGSGNRSGWKGMWMDAVRRRAPSFVCFSNLAAERLSSYKKPVFIVPLTSEMPDELMPAASGPKRHFVFVGRIEPYKNLPMVFRAWDAFLTNHPDSVDRLVLFGDGPPPEQFPRSVEWRAKRFSFCDLASQLPSFKASVCTYRSCSQSGAQVLAMQAGVVPIASSAGALPEYQAPGWFCLEPDDVAGLARAFAYLSDPDRAGALGNEARRRYEHLYSQQTAARHLDQLVTRLQSQHLQPLQGRTTWSQ